MSSSEEKCVLNGALVQFGVLLQTVGMLVQLEMEDKLVNLKYSFPTINLTST